MDDISSTVEQVNEVTRQIKVSIPAELFSKEVEQALVEAMRTANIKGFRQGKAPRHMVESLHGERLRWEVVDRLISSSLNDVIKKNDIDVVGTPELKIDSLESGKNLEYTATVAIFPRPDIKDYGKFSIRVKKLPVADKDVDEWLEHLRQQKATLRKLAFRNTAQEGDVLDAVVQVEIEGEAPTRPEPVRFAIGDGKLPEDVEKALAGLEVEGTREVVSSLPEDFREEKLRGAKATYRVTLNSLSEKVLPEADDEFAKSVDPETQTILELRLKLNKLLNEERERQSRSDAEAEVLNQLVERNPFEVPQVLIDDEIKSLVARTGLVDPRKTDLSKLSMEPFREPFGKVGAKRVQSAIVVDRIGQAEKLLATEEELKSRIKEIAESNTVSEEEVRKYLSQEGRLVGLMLEITRTKVMKFLLDRASIEYYTEEPKEKEGASEGK